MIKKASFWENVKRSIATLAGPAVYGVHELGAADTYVLIAAILSMLGAMIAIWFEDKDGNGYVDILEDEAGKVG